MSNVRFVPDKNGMREFLQSKPVQNLMREKAQEVLGRCPDIGFGYHVALTNQRAQATVGTRSVYAERHNNKHKTLQKALGGGE